MKLYFHAGRARGLKPGQLIEKEKYYNETPFSVMAPFFDAAFLKHLNGLCDDGLSLHGARYLIQVIRGKSRFNELLIELYFEYIRYMYYKDKPSRLQSLFAFDSLIRAREFGTNGRIAGANVPADNYTENVPGQVFEIEYSGGAFIADMNWLKISYRSDEQEYYAKQYWKGTACGDADSGGPAFEFLLNLPVKISREAV